MANVTIDVAAQFKGKPAFDKAGTAVGGLEKTANKLGKTLAGLFATKKIIDFGKASVKAFMEDEKSAAILANTVKNLGLAFAQPEINDFIKKLETSSAVVDDKLRPAMQKLLTTTGDIYKSQKLLAQAVDISRGAGVDLETVVSDLSAAYVGNTKGLKKYNLGLTQAQLKAASFTDIQKKLNDQFSGSSAAYLSTYAGKMELLTTAADNAKESIGKGLIDALSMLGGTGTDDINQAATAMQNLADNTANSIRGIGVLLDKLAGVGKGSSVGNAIRVYWTELWDSILTPYRDLMNLGARSQSSKLPSAAQNLHLQDLTRATNAKKMSEAQLKATKAQIVATKAQTKATKDQAALKKAQGVFDLEMIQKVAALQGKLTEDEKKRVEAQLALLAGNESLATKLTNEILLAQDSSGKLSKFLSELPNAKNPFEYLDAYLTTLKEKVKTLYPSGNLPPVISGDTGNTQVMPQTNAQDYSGFALNTNMPGTAGSGAQFGSSTPWAQAVQINIDGKAVAEALLNQSLSGNQSFVDRRTGGFNW